MIEVKSVKLDRFFEILNSVGKMPDKAEYSVENFLKFKTSDIHQLQYIMFDDGKPVAGCVAHMHCPEFGYVYINELQSFVAGHNYGTMLIRWFDIMNSKLWLCRSYDKPELDKFYTQFVFLNKVDIGMTNLYHKNCDEKLLSKLFR